MKIIKEGNLQQTEMHKLYYFTCKNCGCEFEASKSEGIEHNEKGQANMDVRFHTIICPTDGCGKELYFNHVKPVEKETTKERRADIDTSSFDTFIDWLNSEFKLCTSDEIIGFLFDAHILRDDILSFGTSWDESDDTYSVFIFVRGSGKKSIWGNEEYTYKKAHMYENHTSDINVGEFIDYLEELKL